MPFRPKNSKSERIEIMCCFSKENILVNSVGTTGKFRQYVLRFILIQGIFLHDQIYLHGIYGEEDSTAVRTLALHGPVLGLILGISYGLKHHHK